MKRPLRKLIAFSTAAAVLANLSCLTVSASYFADPVSDQDFDRMIEYSDRNVYIRTGMNGESEEVTKLVVIGKDGKKQLISMEKGINALSAGYPVTRGGTWSAYGFNFDDPHYLLALDKSSCMIAQIGTDAATAKYALVNSASGAVISEMYDGILMLTDHLFAVQNGREEEYETTQRVWDSEQWTYVDKTVTKTRTVYSLGLISDEGKTVFAPTEQINAFSVTTDGQHLLVDSADGCYFADLTGKAVSETYPEVRAVSRRNYVHSFTETVTGGGLANCARLEQDIFCFTLADGNYAIAFNSLEPGTKRYQRVRIVRPVTSEGYVFSNEPEQIECVPVTVTDYDPEHAEYFDISGKAVQFQPDLNRVWLYDGNRNGTQYSYYFAGATNHAYVYDMDRTLLLEGEWIAQQADNGFVMYKDGKYQHYNAKAELVETYDSWDSYNTYSSYPSSFYAKKDGKYYWLDQTLTPNETAMTAEQAENIRSGKMKQITVNGEVVGYYCGTDDQNAEIWDMQFRKSGNFELKPQNGGTLLSESRIVLDFENDDRNLIRMQAEEDVSVPDEEGNAVTVTNRSYETYLLNKNLDMLNTSELYEAKAFGGYFLVRAAEGEAQKLVDANGKTVLTGFDDLLLYDDVSLSGARKDAYVAVGSSSFTIYNSELEELKEIEGKPVNGSVYEKNGKYGFYNLAGDIRTPAEYDSAYEDFEGVWSVAAGENHDPKNMVYSLRKGEYLYFFDGYGNLLNKIETGYQFRGGTADVYGYSCLVLNDRTADGKGRTTVYNFEENEIVYQQTGDYDRVENITGGYAVTANGTAEGDALWTEGQEISRGLVRMETGEELIAPVKGLYISLSKDCNRSIDAEYTEEELAQIDYYVQLRDSFYRTNYAAVKDLDAEFAKANGYDTAVRTKYGCTAVMKDFKWGLTDNAGKVLCEPKFNSIYGFRDGIAFTLTSAMKTEVYTDYRLNEETGVYEETKVTSTYEGECLGVIACDGKEVIKPDPNTEYFNILVMDDTFLTTETYNLKRNDEAPRRMFRAEDHLNEFAQKYDYELAWKYDDLYVVVKDGLTGIVSAENEVIVPIEFQSIISFWDDPVTREFLTDEQKAALGEAPYSTPIITLGDGTKLASFKTADNKIRVYQIMDDSKFTRMGDLNGDGTVNLKDAVLLRRYIAGGWNAEIDKNCADVNGDGEINLKDVVMLRRRIAGGWDVIF